MARPEDTSLEAQETTQALEDDTAVRDDWPVSDLYRVSAEDDSEPDVTGDGTTIVVTSAAEEPAPARRRVLPIEPGPGVLAAIAVAVLCIGLAAWLLTRDEGDESNVASTPAGTSAGSVPSGGPTPEVSSTPTASEAAVPTVVGITAAQARSLLSEAGYRVRVTRRQSTVAAGQVLRQVPPAGAAVEPNDIIVLTVAKPRVVAPVTVSVPEVVALPASEASAALQDAGLRVEIVLVPSSKAAGTVLSQTPAPGTALARSSLVSLEVARAQPVPVARIELPDLVGTNVADARAQLRDLGLRVAVTRVAASQPADTVIRQAPRAGARLREGATVSLRVSTGPQRVSVPDVTGLDEETARMELENAGFDVRVTDESTTDPSEDGLVVRQTPLGGSNAPEGAIVTITVARLD